MTFASLDLIKKNLNPRKTTNCIVLRGFKIRIALIEPS